MFGMLYRRVFESTALALVFLIAGCGGDKDEAFKRDYEGQSSLGSVWDIIEQRDDLSTLRSLLEQAGMNKDLQASTDRVTLFAPDNRAFETLSAEQMDNLSQDTNRLTQLLSYHLVPKREISQYQALKSAGKTVVSGNGDLLSLNRFGEIFYVNGASVLAADLKANEGVVHVIEEVLFAPGLAQRSLPEVKEDIVQLASSFSGMSDPDFTLHRSFEPLLAELLTLSPQSPVEDRIEQLAQPWRQLWGPYDYSSGQEGVDPDLSINEVYQVVFKDGYYYNVTPLLNDDTGEEQIGLLRGEYEFDREDKQCLQVQFVRFPGLAERPDGVELWQLAGFASQGELEQLGVATLDIVPAWVVRSFFGGGQLCEIYTDHELRISISTEDDNPYYRKLYILSKVTSNETINF